MLKLKFLFNNEDLTSMILKNWRHDPDSGEMFKYFRISANAVYPFKYDGKVCFLRYAPISEKTPVHVLGELEFVEYLKKSGYNSTAVILSANGNLLETVKTPWGEYVAVAFEGVPGVQLESMELNDAIIFGYGRALGRLHKLSSSYCPNYQKRWNWRDALDWTRDVLAGFPDEEPAKKEVRLLEDFFSTLQADEKNYGLIHYDFETDNVFLERDKLQFHVIDFDDTMYHWYAMDIEQALDSLTDGMELSEAGSSKSCFIKGYRSQFELSDDMLELLPVFRRFANLYGYVRILRSVQEKWEHEPDWMTGLRKNLEKLSRSRAVDLGKPFLFCKNIYKRIM